MIVVGVPREIKPQERRVGLTPRGVGFLRRSGIAVHVETGAGLASGYSDQEYEKQRAKIVPDARTLYAHARLIQKVKEPQPAEFPYLGRQHILFCFLHLASPENCHLVKALLHAGTLSIGFETVEIEGKTPILKSMSEIAGALAAIYASFFRQSELVRNQKIMLPNNFLDRLSAVASRYPTCPADWDIGPVVIFGGGVPGQKAAEFALRMKGEVSIVEKGEARRNELRNQWASAAGRLSVFGPDDEIRPILEKTDILIGCAHTPGRRAVRVLDAPALKGASLTRKKVVIDVAVDQGGNFPETHATAYDDPLYLDSFGNLRFAVTNMPSLCGRGASDALTEATRTYTAAMARDFQEAMRLYPELARAVNTEDGLLKNPTVKEAHRA